MKIKSWGSIGSIFMDADGVDWMLMVLGLIGAVSDGFITPIVFFICSILLNDLGSSSFNDETFMQAISKVFFSLFNLLFVYCFRSLIRHDKFTKEKKRYEKVYQRWCETYLMIMHTYVTNDSKCKNLI